VPDPGLHPHTKKIKIKIKKDMKLVYFEGMSPAKVFAI
jgi:hypothetical protein